MVYNNSTHCPWASKIGVRVVVQLLSSEHYEICGLVHISNFTSTECGKGSKAIPIYAVWYIYESTRSSHTVCVTIDRFKFIDNNAILDHLLPVAW